MDELIENVILIEEDDANPDPDLLSFQDLKSDPGRVGLESVLSCYIKKVYPEQPETPHFPSSWRAWESYKDDFPL